MPVEEGLGLREGDMTSGYLLKLGCTRHCNGENIELCAAVCWAQLMVALLLIKNQLELIR